MFLIFLSAFGFLYEVLLIDLTFFQEFNEFVERLAPVAAKNNELIKSRLETWEVSNFIISCK